MPFIEERAREQSFIIRLLLITGCDLGKRESRRKREREKCSLLKRSKKLLRHEKRLVSCNYTFLSTFPFLFREFVTPRHIQVKEQKLTCIIVLIESEVMPLIVLHCAFLGFLSFH